MIQSVRFYNYRCLEDLELSFGSGSTLLIGDNATGKTTILRGLRSILSSFFTGYSDDNTRFIGLANDDFRAVENEAGLANDLPIRIEFDLMGLQGSLQLNSQKSRTLQKPISEIKNYGRHLYTTLFEESKQVKALPLFAYYSTSDIHTTRKISKEKFRQYKHKPSFGYYECLNGDGLLPFWTKRLLVLQEGHRTLEIDTASLTLKRALGEEGCGMLDSLDIRHNRGKVFYKLLDDRISETEHLSDGYRRLVSMVMDLSFRCALLNGGMYGTEATLQTNGVVLIDEIELHLHPTLQGKVLKGLRKAFPNVQFVLSTHAPLVMSSLESANENKLYKLAFDPASTTPYQATETTAYGLDASTIIKTVLDRPDRAIEVEGQLKELFRLIDTDRYNEATEALSKLRALHGELLPELAEAETMLHFLIADLDKD